MAGYKVPEAGPEEQRVLSDIKQHTNLDYRRVGGIDTQNEEIARLALHVLITWIDEVDSGLRQEILSRFSTPHASPFSKELFEYWLTETNEITKMILDGVVARVVTRQSGQRIWNHLRQNGRRPAVTDLSGDHSSLWIARRQRKHCSVCD